MKRPTIARLGWNYNLTWEEGLTANVSRVRERGGNVIASVQMSSSMPGMNGLIHQSQLNLDSTRARTEFVRQCEHRVDSTASPFLDWDEAIQQLSILVLAEHRKGEPVIKLTGDLPRDRLEWRIKPLIAEGQANVIYGAGGSAKTFMALYMACLIDIPWNENNMDAEPGRVLYLDYETDHHEIDHRIGMIKHGLGVFNETNILYRFCSQSVADDIEALQELVLEHDINLVIVDSLASASGDEPEKAAPITAFFMSLRSLRVTSLTLHHVNKENKLYGNIYIFNQARNIWEIKKSQEEDTASLNVGLYHRKANNGRLFRPLGFKLDFAETSVHVTRKDVMEDSELAQHATIRDQLRAALLHGAMSVAELTEETKGKAGSIKAALNHYKALFIPVHQDGAREISWGLRQPESSTPRGEPF